MSGYCKLFSDIVESSIWDEPAQTCKVWVTLLALSDADGFVRGSVGWLAGKARVTHDECYHAVNLFQQPDHKSRTPDHDGRRIECLEDGFLILNYLVFRDRLSDSAKAISTRERVRKHRERYKALRNTVSVTPPVSASASASVSASSSEGGCKGGMPNDGWTMETVIASGADPHVGMPEPQARRYFDFRTKAGWVDGCKRDVARTRSALMADMREYKVKEPSMNESGRNGNKGRRDTPTELTRRIEAAKLERDRLPPMPNRTQAQKDRDRELSERIRGWQKELAGG